MKNNEKKYLVTSLLLLLLLILIQLFIYSNLHFHVLNNGFTILHGHPIQNSKSDSSPAKTHHHSVEGYLFLSTVISMDSLVLILYALIIFIKIIFALISFSNYHIGFDPLYLTPCLRAPPSF